MQIDANAKLEFGFRIQSTQESYRELEALLGNDQKVSWARTKAHPNRTKFFGFAAEIDDNGRVTVPDEVRDAFTKHGGFLMVKLVTPLPVGHYANLAMYHRLWEFDKVQAQRENGDWVYSIPIHGLDKAGEGKRFFFIIRIDGTPDHSTLTVDKVTVTRGKHHFSLQRHTYRPITGNAASLPALAARVQVPTEKEITTPLKDLPIDEATEEFLAYLSNGVRA